MTSDLMGLAKTSIYAWLKVVAQVGGHAALAIVAWRILALLRKWRRSPIDLPRLEPSTPKDRPLKRNLPHCCTYFATADDVHLYQRKWLPRYDVEPKAVVFLVHGLGEHGGRYEHVGRRLAQAGFAVFMVDHRGHGLSDGPRMLVSGIEQMAQDYLAFVAHVLRMKHPNEALRGSGAHPVDNALDAHADVDWSALPRFVLGHSMGGVVTLKLVEMSHGAGVPWHGVMLSSPAIECFPHARSRPIMAAVNWLARAIPGFTLPVIPAEEITMESEVQKRMLRDPLGLHTVSHGTTTVLAASIIQDGLRYADEATMYQSKDVDLPPVFLCHGEKDQVTFPTGSAKFYAQYGGKDKTIKLVPDGLHELFHSEVRDELLDEVIDWMDERR